MDFITQIRIMQAIRNLNDSQVAELFGMSRQNYSRKVKNKTFSVDDLQKIADVLGFNMDIIFTDREKSNIESSNDEEIGKKLFELRTNKNLLQSDVARKLDINPKEYINYESGIEHMPPNVLSKACKLYDVSKSYFGNNSNFVAVGNTGQSYAIQNSDSSETLIVSDDEFQAVKEFLKEYRKK